MSTGHPKREEKKKKKNLEQVFLSFLFFSSSGFSAQMVEEVFISRQHRILFCVLPLSGCLSGMLYGVAGRSIASAV